MLVPRHHALLRLIAFAAVLLPTEAFAQGTPYKPRYPKLDSALNTLAERATADAQAIPNIAQQLSLADWGFVEFGPGRVGVTIRFSGSGDGIGEFVVRHHGHIAFTFEGAIEAYLAPEALPYLDALPGIERVDKISRPEPQVTSQGVGTHNGSSWQSAGFLGQGVRVGVIDTGFQGWSALPPTDRPTLGGARCYTGGGYSTPDLYDCQSLSDHGTAVAEAVHDVAPGATFYLANPTTNGEFRDAIQWMLQQDVRVINLSLSKPWDGPGDGTSPYSDSPLKAVDLAVAGGALVTIASGNYGTAAWFGPWRDPDGDDLLEFDGAVHASCLSALSSELVSVELRWQDFWGGATRDLDLELYHLVTGLRVARSNDSQFGLPGHVPHEALDYSAPVTGTYCVLVRHYAGSYPAWVQFRVKSKHDVDIFNSATSVTSPAETANAGALAVGAANWQTTYAIEPYSGRGPTVDGRTKPEIVGVDKADSVTFGPNGFPGTSQAAPHVAGLAALLLVGYPSHTPVQLATRLKDWALPRGGAVPNNTWGYGLAHLVAVYNLSISKAGAGAGTVTSTDGRMDCGTTCLQTYFAGDTVTLTATPMPGSSFQGWSGGGCTGSSTCTVTLNAATSIVATFNRAPSALTVTKHGTGSGTVNSVPAGISCGSSCSSSFVTGTTVTLSATPTVGSTFTGWSGGGCAGSGACSVTLTGSTTVGATFALNSYPLTVSRSGAGTGTVISSPAGVNCGSTCSQSFSHGSVVTLTAAPATGSIFGGWSGGGCSGTGTCTVTMTSATTITATFATRYYELTVSRTGNGTGTVESVGGAISCGTTCSASFAHGAFVTLTAIPTVDSVFQGWSGDGCSGTASCTVSMTVRRNVVAGFGQRGTPLSYYLAEGATNGFFDLDVLVANPNAQPAPVTLTFLNQNGSVESLTDMLPATSRRTYGIGRSHMPSLATAAGVSTVVESSAGLPLVVERSMFWSQRDYYSGHGGTAVASTERRWYFGEGSQGFFDTYVLLANSGGQPAHVTVTFLLDAAGSEPVVLERTVAANSRDTVWAGDRAELIDKSFSIVVDADVPIIAERAMYWTPVGGPFWVGGHESAGVPSLSKTWLLAEGATGPFFDNYVLVGNPGELDAEVKFTFLLLDGRVVVGTPQGEKGPTGLGFIRTQSRFTLDVENAGLVLDILEGDAAWLADAALSTKVESSEPVVVERAMYWPGTFATWAEAHNSFGVTETGTAWGLAEGRNGGTRAFETYILVANPSEEDATIKVTFLLPDGTTRVLDKAEDGISPLVAVKNSRFNVTPGQMPSGEFGAVVESTNGVPIVVERAMYWTPPGGPFWSGGTNALATKLQ